MSKKYNQSMKKKLKPSGLIILFAVFVLGLATVLMPAKPAYAASIPLEPDCYFRVSPGNFQRTNCPAQAFDDAVRSRDTCFVTQSSGSEVYFEIDCDPPDGGLDLVGGYNTERAKRVCDDMTEPHYWSSTTDTCYHGPNCLTAGGISGSGCTADSVSSVFGKYLRGEYTLATTSSTPTPAPSTGSGSGSGTGSNTGGFLENLGNTISGNNDTTGQQEELSEEDKCKAAGNAWNEGEEEPCKEFALANDCTESAELDRNNCKILDYLVISINVLSVLAGLAMIFSFIFAGYLYITARDNPQFVQMAKTRVLWTVIALFLYLFMYALLNWLVPGGVLPG